MTNQKNMDFSVKALIINNGKFLIMHDINEKQDIWEFPGGRMEFGETIEQTVTRELKEETGLDVTPLKVFDTWNYVNKDYQIVGLFYLCSAKSTEVRLSNEHNDFRWIEPTEETLTLLHPVFRERMISWDWKWIFGYGY